MHTTNDLRQFAAQFTEADSARELAQRWLLALRSGELAQGVGSLTQVDLGESVTHCCLGALCAIDGTLRPAELAPAKRFDVTWEDSAGRYQTWSLEELNPPPVEFGSKALQELTRELSTPIDEDTYRRCTGLQRCGDEDVTIMVAAIRMNDGGRSFGAIADMLEELLLPLLP